ncbi:hypothetical protein PHYSODRAFT_323740 [Phytophthora sojae]|uniref:Protein kinase domain-containing protein n=1 Tax=Phytophthora sojae (strain P6497) TaxID=1094619 RepID=G4YLG8_PHYSP|nr:hypothetical protein PHYSODRAFT_323740 [Phytophthora sojae]EGZ30342.1 hypothetical protein PHYSODRAFT_323740 [Phytophthora sojae]|eukprot:XP_009517617.1 hypothetical protein PHYSODRAFT_323740 [Phytophthora sojae]
MNILEDVEDFSWALDMLKRKLITRFQTEVNEYERIVNKFSRKSILKQLVFHQDLDNASANAKKTKENLLERLTTECSIEASATYRTGVPIEERNKRYMDFVDSSEAINAMSDPENQKEVLAIIARMGRRNDVMMQNSLESRDCVASAMKEKLWASWSRSTRADISSLPDWYMTEDEVDIDMSTAIGFVKIYNKKTVEAKDKFFSTMKLWERRSRYDSICRFYDACYFTATSFVVMEYCEKGPLDTFLRRDGANRCKIGLDILAQAAQGIAKMHSIGIVHGDLKTFSFRTTLAMKDRRLVNGTAADAGIEITDAFVTWSRNVRRE